MRLFLSILLLLALAEPALASEGVLEINQTCAVQTGCFPGDTAGFPVTVTEPGSYALTSNLLLDGQNGQGGYQAGIQLNAHSSLDMRGFGIRADFSTAISSTAPVSIKNGFVVSLAGSLSGPLVTLGGRSRVSDFYVSLSTEIGAGPALGCGTGCVLTDIRIDVTETDGISCGSECVIARATIHGASAGETAILCGSGCVLTGITTTEGPILAGARTRVLDSQVSSSSANGSSLTLTVGDDSIVSGCAFDINQSGGGAIICGQGCVISGNTFSGRSGFDPYELLTVGSGSRIERNVFRNAIGVAFDVGVDVGYSDNVFSGNNGGNANPQVTGGTDLGGNLCGTRTSCP